MKTIKLNNWSNVPDNYTGIVEFITGDKDWFLNGKRHREDGPAIEYASGHNAWWLNGSRYTEEDYKTEMMKRSSTVGKLLMKRTQL